MGSHREFPDAGQLKAQLERLRDRKGDLNRAIGAAKKTGANTDELIKKLKTVSSEIKELQKTLKKQLTVDEQPKAWFPGTPDVPSPILDNPVAGEVRIVDAFACREFLAAADAYVRAHPAGSIWHSTGTTRFIEATSGHQTRYLCALDENNRVIGVLPLVRMKSRLFGDFIVSVPYFNYGGVLANHRKAADLLANNAVSWRDETGAAHVELRHAFDIGFKFPKRTDKLTFWLPLPEAKEDLWNSFRPKVRAQIRRGEREADEVVFGGKELLSQFYQVFARNMRDLGTPVYGKEFFSNLLRELGSGASLVVVKKNGRPVGCAFIAGQGGRLEIPWASTIREENYTGINMLMYWRILEYAIQNKYQIFDFGRCSRGAGTSRFKRQWGASEIPLFWDYALPEGKNLPELNPDNPKFRLLIAIWKRMPVWMSRLIGPGIVKNLP
jgi:FemAB-related protein (PEP-CTERM system-associated)